jgi:hypothetical protein
MVVGARQRLDANAALATHITQEEATSHVRSHVRWFGALGTFALLAGLGSTNANAQQIKTVFVIAMENHNWTQPTNQFSGPIQQVFQYPTLRLCGAGAEPLRSLRHARAQRPCGIVRQRYLRRAFDFNFVKLSILSTEVP